MRVRSTGFTLLELMVVIAIIGLLSAVVFGSLNDTKDKAKEVTTIKNMRNLNEAIFMYELDTSTKFDCTTNTDCTQNLIVNPGLGGWDGPYFLEATHPWGGPIIISRRFSAGLDPNDPANLNKQTFIYLNSGPQNRLRIPDDVMLSMDKSFDDGNLSTGSIRGMKSNARASGPGIFSPGEMLIKPKI